MPLHVSTHRLQILRRQAETRGALHRIECRAFRVRRGEACQQLTQAYALADQVGTRTGQRRLGLQRRMLVERNRQIRMRPPRGRRLAPGGRGIEPGGQKNFFTFWQRQPRCHSLRGNRTENGGAGRICTRIFQQQSGGDLLDKAQTEQRQQIGLFQPAAAAQPGHRRARQNALGERRISGKQGVETLVQTGSAAV